MKASKKFNILIVSLDNRFSKLVAATLAEKLDMFVVDCREMLVYDLSNRKEIIEKCGIEYLKTRETSVLEKCASFQNTVISINYDLFHEYSKLFINSVIIYLKLNNAKVKETTNKIAYQSRDQFISKNCDFSILLDKKSKINSVKMIIEKLSEVV